ncbi:MAG: DUF3014 domain-containing protein [Gammaproteobacteria bacterium]
MNRASWVLLALLAIGASAYLIYQKFQPEPAEISVSPAPAEAAPELPAASASVPEPIETMPPPAPAQPAVSLPALDDSDSEVHDAAVGIFGDDYVEQFLVPADIVRKLVVTTDNAPRDKIALRLRAVPPLPGKFVTEGDAELTVLSEQNFERYTPWVTVFANAPATELAEIYARYYPLFQQAYVDLGYPDQQFHHRMLQMIDDLLAAPEVDEPVYLVRPHVLYQFANPDLEALSAGQKALIRMGPVNAGLVKRKLREIRPLIVSAGQN